MKSTDIVIIGAGIAGASLAWQLSAERSVVLLEAEDLPGRHATGRSAAIFIASYGNPVIRGLTRAGREFFLAPPAGFTSVPLCHPRACMYVASAPHVPNLRELAAEADIACAIRGLSAAEARAAVPILDRDWVADGLLDESGFDIDVAALHQGYLTRARQAGVELVTGVGQTTIARRSGQWIVRSAIGEFAAPVLVNGAGAWGDRVAAQAEVAAVGLQPKRRTAVTLPAPAGHAIDSWPMVVDAGWEFYFKPDAGTLLLSPANEDPEEPGDTFADDLDVAIAVDRFENATTVEVTRVLSRWAGQRTFAPDHTPVVGFDALAPEGFFWLVGQGGYGIQTAPALSRVAAALVLGKEIPADIAQEGVAAAMLSPNRASLRKGHPGSEQGFPGPA